MFRLLCYRLCLASLANGTILDGELNPNNKEMLLKGSAKLSDGRVFHGRFHATHGYPLPGTELYDDGDRYRGEFNERWQRHGSGEAWLQDGTYYRGKFANDELVDGMVRIPNGISEIKFTGTLHDELFVRGKLEESNYTYEGEFENNQPCGKGKLIFVNGAEQEGTFYAGKLHGSNCKMKLNNGYVYVGEFFDGHIRTGTLYTPTYTYEGQFNDHGKAHGEGQQTYLITEPRLTFTGIWAQGMMMSGTCVDEHGTAVDWQNNHALQAKVLGEGDERRGEEQLAVNTYCDARVEEVKKVKNKIDTCYVADAEKVAKRTGIYPSKFDLGYEKGLAANSTWAENSVQDQQKGFDNMKKIASTINDEYEVQKKEVSRHIIGDLNENMAKMHFIHQKSAEELAKQRVDEQFERFMKTFDKPVRHGTSKVQNALGDRERLNIDGNYSWKSFLPSDE